MSKTLSSLFCLLVVASSAFPAPKITGPHEVKQGGFAQLVIDGAGKTVIWSISPEPIQEVEIIGTLIFTGRAGVDYTATAIVIDFVGKTAEKVKHSVRFLGGPVPPGPDPGPAPVPPLPPPVDPLTDAVRAAAKTDGWPAEKLVAMSVGLAAASDVSKSRATWTVAELAVAMQAAIKSAVGGPTPPTLKKLLGDMVNAVLPRDAEHVLTTDEMVRARELLLKLSRACLEASR